MNWITLNEPLSYSMNGYTKGTFAPGRCSKYVGNCTEGNSATEPYIVAHNLLLAHATAVKIYREKYQVINYYISLFHNTTFIFLYSLSPIILTRELRNNKYKII